MQILSQRSSLNWCSYLRRYSYLFLQRREGKEKEREKHQCVVASRAPPTGDLACNPGTCPDWESNQWPLGSQTGTQFTEPPAEAKIVLNWKKYSLKSHFSPSLLSSNSESPLLSLSQVVVTASWTVSLPPASPPLVHPPHFSTKIILQKLWYSAAWSFQ